MKDQVEAYQRLVLEYEALDEEIDRLIMAYGGTADKMTPEALMHYRELARKRDDIQNEMRVMEQTLMDDGTDYPKSEQE